MLSLQFGMMENGNVVIFEDHESLRRVTAQYVQHLGHTVTAEAATLDSALETVAAIAKGDVACDAVILDGNLSHGDTSGDDAAVIAARLRQLQEPVKIIGYSQRPMCDYGVRVDFDTRKSIDRLREALDQL